MIIWLKTSKQYEIVIFFIFQCVIYFRYISVTLSETFITEGALLTYGLHSGTVDMFSFWTLLLFFSYVFQQFSCIQLRTQCLHENAKIYFCINMELLHILMTQGRVAQKVKALQTNQKVSVGTQQGLGTQCLYKVLSDHQIEN